MKHRRSIAVALLAVAMLASVVGRRSDSHAMARSDGYYVLRADLHLHSLPGDWAALAPWDDILEARRAGLDVVALTSHNHVWAGLLGHWLTRNSDSPLVLVGEEIVGPGTWYHLVAIGIHSSIDWRQPVADAIDAVHAQGGVAIAAHPMASLWPNYDARALQTLDGAEVLHPLVYISPRVAEQIRAFFTRGDFAAIGDSDYRGFGSPGVCRTYIFARERTEQGVLEAIRAHRTVVYDDGTYYGQQQFVDLARRDHVVPTGETGTTRPSDLHGVFVRIVGVCGLLLLILSPFPPRRPRSASPAAR